jgi:acyl carrier protein
MILKVLSKINKIPKKGFCFSIPGNEIKWTREPQPRVRTKTSYYSDPEAMALIVASLISLHDNLKTEDIKLTHTFKELGLSETDKIDIIFALEIHLDTSIPPEYYEKFKNVYDVVQYLSKSMFIH